MSKTRRGVKLVHFLNDRAFLERSDVQNVNDGHQLQPEIDGAYPTLDFHERRSASERVEKEPR